MLIERTVVGWDGSAPAEQALRWAADRAERRRITLHVVRVLDPETASEGVTAARTALHDAVAALGHVRPDLPVTAELVVGRPSEQLARVAERSSLLVIGASRTGRVRHPEARRVPVAVVGRGQGITAVIPADAPEDRAGVVAVLRGRDRSAGPLLFAARAARESGQPLTLLRLRDPYEPVDGDDPVTLDRELRTVAREYPGLSAELDPRWVRSPISLLSHSDHAALLVLEGRRPTTAPPRFSLERWLAGQARAPFVVVAEPTVEDTLGDPAIREHLALAG
ncbi:MAG: universal stress protein [Amnibacterium sp.]